MTAGASMPVRVVPRADLEAPAVDVVRLLGFPVRVIDRAAEERPGAGDGKDGASER